MSMSNEEKEGPWSNLQIELLDLIMRRLSFVDQLSFRAVCKSWCSVNNIRLADQRPWLLVFSEDMDEYSWRSCNVINPSTKKSHAIDMSSIRKKNKKLHNAYETQVHQSKYGWLMISSYHPRKLVSNYSRSLYLFTPFRNHNNLIELPTMNRSKSFEFATFSSDPLRKDCLFLTVKPDYINNSLSIKTCCHGDNSWRTITGNFTKCDLSIGMIVTWLYSEGILYYADRKGRVGAFDITTLHTRGSSTDHVLLPKIPNLPLSVQNGLCTCSVDMVKLDGLLFCFFRISSFEKLYRIDVRLDHSLMTWKEIVHQYCKPSMLSSTIPNITLLLGDAGYRSVLKYSEDGEIEMVYDCSRAQLCDDNSPFRICFQAFGSSRVHYQIDHPLACISN